MDEITNVWNEVRVTADGISITLFSERASGGATVEDEAWFTFDEMAADAPQSPISLNLSDRTSDDWAETRRLARVGQIMDEGENEKSHDLPKAGDVLTDRNPAPWSEDTQVEVVEVLPNVSCDEYVIQGQNEGDALTPSSQAWSDETVADSNPSYDEDEPVVRGRYVGSEKVYAFPASRLA